MTNKELARKLCDAMNVSFGYQYQQILQALNDKDALGAVQAETMTRDGVPVEAFQCCAVYDAMAANARRHTSPENVSDVLDGLMSLIKMRSTAPQPSLTAEPAGEVDAPTMGRFCPIKEIIDELTDIYTRFGNTCVYIREGGFGWGAVALNRLADDKEAIKRAESKPADSAGGECECRLAIGSCPCCPDPKEPKP